MTNLFCASALAALLCASAGLPNTYTINMETNVTRQASSDEEAIKEATELIRQSHFSSEGLPAAEKGLWRLLEEHRDSRIAYILSTLLESVQERQALHELNIAMFYMYKHPAPIAAEGRLKGIISKYPKYSRLDDVLYQLALLQIETGRGAEAKETLQGLLNRPGFNSHAMEARDKLEALKSGK